MEEVKIDNEIKSALHHIFEAANIFKEIGFDETSGRLYEFLMVSVNELSVDIKLDSTKLKKEEYDKLLAELLEL